MKKFKKRFAKYCVYTEVCNFTDNEMGCSPCEDTREEGWRWAYQSIRNEIKRLQGTRRAISIIEVVAFIDEELDE